MTPEQLRQQEKGSVIASVRQKVQEYGITARELGFTATGTVIQEATTTSPMTPPLGLFFGAK